MIKGIGVDIIRIARIKQAMMRRPRLRERVFTPGELAYAMTKSNPWPSLAARFAAKEAAMKALGVGLWDCGMQEIEVIKAENGPPALHLHGRALALAQARAINQWHLSLSHSEEEAVAFAIAEET